MKATEEIILNYIINYITKHGYSPTTREICNGTNLKSTNTVNRYIHIMLDAGILETDADFRAQRAIRVPNYKFERINKEDTYAERN